MTNNAHKARFHMEARNHTTNVVVYQQGEAVGFWKHLNDADLNAVVQKCLAERLTFSTGHSDLEMVALFGETFLRA